MTGSVEHLATDYGDLMQQQAATFNEERTHRYLLTHAWTPSPLDEPRVVVWVMLNPSTADAFTLDPTLRRCRDFSQRWGYDGMVILNLFAFRATNPQRLRDDDIDPVGPANDAMLRSTARFSDDGTLWVAGWGVHGRWFGRDRVVAQMLHEMGVELHAVAVNKDGDPGHPLFVAATAKLVRWPVAAVSS